MDENVLIDRSEGDVNLGSRRMIWNKGLPRTTKDILTRDSNVFLHQSLSTPCINALKGSRGAMLVDFRGAEILDFHGNSAHQLGYGNERIVNAIKEAMDVLPFCPRRYTNEPAVKLAEKLVELAPDGLGKVLFAPAGTLAVSMALKLTRLALRRHKIISWKGSFHGASLDSISAGCEELFRAGMEPLMEGVFHLPEIPPASHYNSEEEHGAALRGIIARAKEIFECEEDIGAVIVEPIRCTTVVAPPVWFWSEIRSLCDTYGALLIFDEIPVCLGRTGRMFACEHYDAVPDILCIGKGLGGGVLPLAAIIARNELDIAGNAAIGHFTHEKNPVAAAAGFAALQVIQEEYLLDNACRLGEYALSRLWEMADKYAFIRDVRGVGLLLAVELGSADALNTNVEDAAEQIMYSALESGLNFKISSGNVLTLTPPLTVSLEQMNRALDILNACFSKV